MNLHYFTFLRIFSLWNQQKVLVIWDAMQFFRVFWTSGRLWISVSTYHPMEIKRANFWKRNDRFLTIRCFYRIAVVDLGIMMILNRIPQIPWQMECRIVPTQELDRIHVGWRWVMSWLQIKIEIRRSNTICDKIRAQIVFRFINFKKFISVFTQRTLTRAMFVRLVQ